MNESATLPLLQKRALGDMRAAGCPPRKPVKPEAGRKTSAKTVAQGEAESMRAYVVVLTAQGRESLAERSLREYGYDDVYFPLRFRREFIGKKPIAAGEYRFPGYGFVLCDRDPRAKEYQPIPRLPGIEDMMRSGETPHFIDAPEIREIHLVERDEFTRAKSRSNPPRGDLAPGDKVEIVHGNEWTGVTGEIIWIKRWQVKVFVMGRIISMKDSEVKKVHG